MVRNTYKRCEFNCNGNMGMNVNNDDRKAVKKNAFKLLQISKTLFCRWKTSAAKQNCNISIKMVSWLKNLFRGKNGNKPATYANTWHWKPLHVGFGIIYILGHFYL